MKKIITTLTELISLFAISSLILWVFVVSYHKYEEHLCSSPNKTDVMLQCMQEYKIFPQAQYDAYYSIIKIKSKIDILNNNSLYKGVKLASYNCSVASLSKACTLHDYTVIDNYIKQCAFHTKTNSDCVIDYLRGTDVNDININLLHNFINSHYESDYKKIFHNFYMILAKDEENIMGLNKRENNKYKSKKIFLNTLMDDAQKKSKPSDYITYVFHYGKYFSLTPTLKEYLFNIDYNNKGTLEVFINEYCDYFMTGDSPTKYEKRLKTLLDNLIEQHAIKIQCKTYNGSYSKSPDFMIRNIR